MKRRSTLLVATTASLALAAAAQAQPAADTIVVGLSADINTFEPANISSRDNANIARHIFGTLYTISGDGEVSPDLAENLEISDDGLNYVYTLREGLTCHDGEALTAEDAAYSFNRAKDPANQFTGNTPGFVFSSIGFESAEALDDRRVQINIARKNPIAFGLIAEVYIHCKDSYEAMSLDEAAANPIGSGPYRLASWNRGSDVVLEKVENPNSPANMDRIVWRIIPEASTRSAELIAGNVDIITNVAPDQIDAVNASGAAEVQAVQGTRRMYVGFNLSEEFAAQPGGDAIQDPAVRRALQYAVDVPSICTQLLNFECERATGIVNPPNANQSLTPYPYDPEMAEKLLDEAGWPRQADGNRFSIKLQAGQGRYLNDRNVVLAIGQYLSDVGLDVEVELMEWASVYVPLIRQRAVGPLFFLGSGGRALVAALRHDRPCHGRVGHELHALG
jgi:peptide/nickel transport system substrate-binding protein